MIDYQAHRKPSGGEIKDGDPGLDGWGRQRAEGRRRAVMWLAGWGILFTLSEEGRGGEWLIDG